MSKQPAGAYSEDRSFVSMPTGHPQNLTGSREVLAIDCSDLHWTVGGYMGRLSNASWYNDEEHRFKIAKNRGRPPENAHIGTTTRDPDVDIAGASRAYGAWVEGPVTDPGDLAAVFARAVKAVEQGEVAVVDVRTSNL